MKKTDSSVQIINTVISGTNRERVLRRIFLQRKNLLHVVTVNPEFVIQAKDSTKFRKVLESAEETVADGWGVVWAAKILQGKKIDRLTGVEIVEEILKEANERGEKVFLLGARVGVAELAAKKMNEQYPKVKIGWYEGARKVKREKREEAGMTLAKINSFEPDYLLVAYGSPWQDMWIEENREYLRARVAIGIGGVLDEWAGVVKRCPKWVDNIGLKWLWRLANEPWRFRRQVKLIKFGWLVLLEKVLY